MICGSVAFACLGNELKGAKMLPHPFYGSQKVVEVMKKLKGWEEGLIVLQPGMDIEE
jgi:hypothetical protein